MLFFEGAGGTTEYQFLYLLFYIALASSALINFSFFVKTI